MKKSILFSILVLFIASNVYALGETNCSNFDGSLKRVEKEIWGANPVTWSVDGTEFDRFNAKEEFDYDTMKSLMLKSSHIKGAPGMVEVYAIMVEVKADTEVQGTDNPETATKSDWVICKSWRNDAIDIKQKEEGK